MQEEILPEMHFLMQPTVRGELDVMARMPILDQISAGRERRLRGCDIM